MDLVQTASTKVVDVEILTYQIHYHPKPQLAIPTTLETSFSVRAKINLRSRSVSCEDKATDVHELAGLDCVESSTTIRS